jgi:hypothetical protein
MTREEARRSLKEPSTGGVNATPLNVARPGRWTYRLMKLLSFMYR